MKKVVLIGMLLISGLSFAHDLEHREYQEDQVFENPRVENKEERAEEIKLEKQNEVKHEEFMEELDHMDRGHEGHE